MSRWCWVVIVVELFTGRREEELLPGSTEDHVYIAVVKSRRLNEVKVVKLEVSFLTELMRPTKS